MVALTVILLFSGAALALGVLYPSLWILSVLALLPFAHVLYSLPEHSHKKTAAVGFVYGAAYSGVAIMWFWHVLPIDWADTTFTNSVLFVGFSWLMVTCTLALFFILFALFFVTYRARNWQDATMAASAWTLMQYAQLWGFAILTARDLSFAGPHFSPTMLGYALAGTPLLKMASLGGIYALTFVAAWAGFFLYHILTTYHSARARIIIAVTCVALFGALASSTALFARNESTGAVRIALVSTELPVSTNSLGPRRTQTQVVASFLRTWMKEHEQPDIVVFPEAANFFRDSGENPGQFTRELSPERPLSIIDSGPVGTGSDRLVHMLVYDDGVLQPNSYEKVFLVPQGEYTPWLFGLFLRAVGVDDAEQSVLRERSVQAGRIARAVRIGDIRAGALFCSDILSPRLYRALTNDGAQVFINPSGQAWFHNSKIVDTLVMTLAKVRAVESDRYIVIAGNGMPSSIIRNDGAVQARSSGHPSILAATVPLYNTQTPYTHLGEYVLLVPAFILLIHIWRRKSSSR